MNNQAASQWWIERETKRKIRHAESEIAGYESLIKRLEHIKEPRYREHEIARVKRMIEFSQLRLDRLKRNGHPF